jgi:hypothetical protein
MEIITKQFEEAKNHYKHLIEMTQTRSFDAFKNPEDIKLLLEDLGMQQQHVSTFLEQRIVGKVLWKTF